MRHRRIHADDEVEALHKSGCFREIIQFRGEIMQDHARRRAADQ